MLTGYQSVCFLTLLFGSVNAFEVNVSGEWKADLGWEVSCAWRFANHDRMQSVRLYKNDQQFLIYRPEMHGPSLDKTYHSPEIDIEVDCSHYDKEQKGHCLITMSPHLPPTKDIRFTCEVSEERPRFTIVKKEFLLEAFVAPSDAVMVISIQREQSPTRVMLNCTSAGLPAPNIDWSIGLRKVPAEFSNRFWNETSKLWHVWSSLSATPLIDQKTPVACSPTIHSENNRVAKGENAEYMLEDINAGQSISLVGPQMCLICLILLRILAH